MKKIIYLLFLQICFAAGLANAQVTQVTGIVRDEKETLIGASVIEKGTSNGTVTDAGGNFKITLRRLPAVLTITYTGYLSKDVRVSSSGPLNINLEVDAKGLQEIIVTGYSQKSKLTSIGAVSQISGQDINGIPNANVTNALAGRLPGFSSQQRTGEPGRDNPFIYIRGANSLSGNNNPLIILDDIEITADQLSQLDANEIETFSILKDASTTAIYGVEGANGVLVITTKRGKAGKPVFNLTASTGINEYIKTPKFLDAYQTATLTNQAYTNDGLTPMFTQNDLDLFKSGADPYGHPNTDWVNVLFNKTAPQSQANLDVSGGTDLVKYYINLGAYSQRSQLKNIDPYALADPSNTFNRTDFRTNLDITPNKRFKISFDMTGGFRSLNEPAGTTSVGGVYDVWNDVWQIGVLNPYTPAIRNPNGTWASNKWNTGASFASKIAESGYRTSNFTSLMFKLSGTHQLDFITKGLAANFNVSYNNQVTDSRTLTRGTLPAYSYDINTGLYTTTSTQTQTPIYALGGGNAALTKQLTVFGRLTYDRTFGQNHHVNALVVYNQQSFTSLYNLPVNTRGFTGQFDYDYKATYGARFTLARNGTDKYKGSKQYQIFPAGGVYWNVGEERFFQKIFPYVDVLKLRANLGLVGSNAGPAGGITGQVYNSGTAYNFGNTPNNSATTVEGALVNTDINWELERKVDVGIDLTLFKKLSFTFDYFDDYRYDQVITPGNYSLVFGQTLGSYNLGRTVNRGLEASIAYSGKAGKVAYHISPNISIAKNKILYNGVVAAYPYLDPVGKPMGIIQGYIADGFLTDADMAAIAAGKEAAPASAVRAGFLKYLDLNGDNIVDSRDQALIGKPNLPTTVFGLNTGLTYKNFSFDVLFQGATDYSIKFYERIIDLFNAQFQPIHELAWTPATAATAKYPVLTTQGTYNYGKSNNSTFWNPSVSYVRLKQAQLSYQLPVKLIQKLHLKALALTASGYNLLTWTNYDQNLIQVDPEVSSISTAGASANTNTIGDKASSSTPTPRQYVFGVRLTF